MAAAYKDRRQYLAELCVYGFIRNHSLKPNTIPDDLINLCLSMYHNVIDKWDEEISDKKIIFEVQTGNAMLLRKDVWQSYVMSDAFGSIIVEQNEIQIWEFRTLSELYLGIIDNNTFDQNRGWMFNYRKNAYGLSTRNGNKICSEYGTEIRSGKEYAVKCTQNEIISMILDMTGDRYATLSFKINDKDYGIAFDKINIHNAYRMIVSLYTEDSIDLLQ